MARKRAKKLTDEIRDAIDNSPLSRYAICKQLGIPESSMSKFMHGGGLSMENLDRLAELLNLHVTTEKNPKSKKQTG